MAKFNFIVRYILSKGRDKDGGILSGLANLFAKMFLSSAGYLAYRVPGVRADLHKLSNDKPADIFFAINMDKIINLSVKGDKSLRDDAIKAVAEVSGISLLPRERDISPVMYQTFATLREESESKAQDLITGVALFECLLESSAQKGYNSSFKLALKRIKSELEKLEDLGERVQTRQIGKSSEGGCSPVVAASINAQAKRVLSSEKRGGSATDLRSGEDNLSP